MINKNIEENSYATDNFTASFSNNDQVRQVSNGNKALDNTYLTLNETALLLTSYLISPCNPIQFGDVEKYPCIICEKKTNSKERILCVNCFKKNANEIYKQLKENKDPIKL